MSKWRVVSNGPNAASEWVEFGAEGRGAFHRGSGEALQVTHFRYEIRPGRMELGWEDEWESKGGIVPLAAGRLFFFLLREDFPEPGRWFTQGWVLGLAAGEDGGDILPSDRAGHFQFPPRPPEQHDGKAVRAAIQAAGKTQLECAAQLRTSISTFRRMLALSNWTASDLQCMGRSLHADLFGPYLEGFPGHGWIAPPDGSGLLRFRVDGGEDG